MASEIVEKRIKEHEGYRDMVYLDSRGLATIGYGHLVTEEDNFEPKVQYPKAQLLELFKKDLDRAEKEADELVGQIEELHIVAKDCIIEMCFQLGKNGVRKFTKMLLALEERDYKTASLEMLDSKWHNQTPERCKMLSSLMEYCR
jgi:lysozyme|tara:strand:- start:1840 stop:2274 length:435 start_codon:yes stop_codon:yes gene_type:complete